MMDLEPLERAVLEKLLEGDSPILEALRRQIPGLRVVERERTGAGFFTSFSTAPAVEPAQVGRPKLQISDVEASIFGLDNGAGFVLYIDDGRLGMLEGFSYEEPWPKEIGEFSLRNSGPDRAAMLAKLRGA